MIASSSCSGQHREFPALLGVAGILLAASSLFAAAPAPLLIVPGYKDVQAVATQLTGRYDRHHRVQFRCAAADLDAVSSVMVVGNGSLGKDALEALPDFLKRGGSLVLVGKAANPILKSLSMGGSEVIGQVGVGFECGEHVLFADTMQMEDLLAEETAASPYASVTFREVLTGASGGAAYLWQGDYAAAYEWQSGAGKILYLAPALLFSEPLEGTSTVEEQARHLSFSRRLFSYLEVPKLADTQTNADPVLWFREPPVESSGWEGARSFDRPHPQEDERLTTLALVAGRGEHERRMIYSSCSNQPTVITWELSSLAGAQAMIPPERLKLGYQGRPTPEYTGPLVYVRWLEAGTSIADPQPVMTWWLQIDVGYFPAGDYAGKLKLSFDGKAAELPITLSVKESAIPRNKPFPFDLEFNVYSLKYWYHPDWLPHWQSLGVDTLISSETRWHLPDPTLRSTGQPLLEYAAAQPQSIGDQLPPLDFSHQLGGRFDLLLQQAIVHGMTTFRTYGLMGMKLHNFRELAQALYKEESLTEESPEVRATAVAYMRALREFLHEKGYVRPTSKTMDEWPSQAIPDYLRIAQPAAEAGWLNVANPTVFVLADREQRKVLGAVIHEIWMEGHPELWYDLKARWPDKAYDSFWTSSYWWNAPYLTGLQLGWGSAYRRHDAFHLHGWTRSLTGGSVWLPDDLASPCPSLAMLMFAEGLEEAQYAFMLQDMLDVAGAEGASLRAAYADILDTSSDALLPVALDYVEKPQLSRQAFTEAKRRVLDLLQDASALASIRSVRPTLSWDGTVLVEDGLPKAKLIGDSQAVAILKVLIKSETGVVLSETNSDLTVHLALLPRTELADVTSETYPGEGAYLILRKGDTLWIASGDRQGLLVGAMNFFRTCTLTPYWYRP